MPDAAAFTALARSSPWRWTRLRFRVSWRGERQSATPLHARLRRPDRLRVEDDAGRLLQIVTEQRSRVGLYTTDGGRTVELPWPLEGPAPVRRPDGLIAHRPSDLSYDGPMYQDYRWLAMLDPVELADGHDPETGEPAGPPLEFEELREVEHGGRPAWEATVRTTTVYEPRCGCCPLLRDPRVDLAEWGAEEFAGAVYPTAHLLRLDVQTGVCVWTEELGGTFAGDGHDLRIEAVDEPMADDLFRTPPRRPRRYGWSPLPEPGLQEPGSS